MSSLPLNRLGIVVLILLIAAVPTAAIGRQPDQAADGERQDIAGLQRALAGEPSADEVRALIPDILAASRRDDDAAAALPLVEQAIKVLQSHPRDDGDISHVTLLLHSAARLRFDQLDPPGAEAHLQTLLELHRGAKDRAGAGSDPLAWPRQLVAVTLSCLRGGSLAPALDVLGELADLNLPDERLVSGHEQVSAALNRRLEALSTDARYELLYRWVMPDGGRTNVRCWSSITPVEAPPSVFARAIGERPGDSSFPIAQVNGLTGLFSIEWQLIDAAHRSGRLRRLTTELERLARDGVADAEYLLLLARIADGGQPSPAEELNQRLASASLGLSTQGRPPAGRRGQLDRVTAWTVVAAAGLSDPTLLPTSQAIFDRAAALSAVGPAVAVRPFYRRAALEAAARQFSDRGEAVDDPALRHWLPAQVDQRRPGVFAETRSVWGQHEGHLFRLSGPGDDWLCFRYPLEGDFEFEVDALDGGTSRLSSQLLFDAQTFTPSGATSSTQIGVLGRTDTDLRPSPFIRRETWPAYQRLKVQVVDSVMTLSINGHPIFSQPRRDRASPWLGLSAPGHQWTIFRNLKLTGASIPREVPLSDGTRLSGWYWQPQNSPPAELRTLSALAAPQATAEVRTTQVQPSPAQPGLGTRILRGLFGGSVADQAPQPAADEAPQRSADAVPQPAAVGDAGSLPAIMTTPAPPPEPWRVVDGEIHADPDEPRHHGPANRLTYFRPLQNGESLRYEFYYEPDSYHVHPTLGRLSFRLEPGGIRVRWLTDSENDWTGLPLNHELAEPLSRRGPRSLPLVEGDWNRLNLSLDNDTVTLELNETQVYVRKLEPEVGRCFSLCAHDGSAVRVRSVVLSGDWPERMDDDTGSSLVAHREPPGEQHCRSLDAMLSGRHIADAALDVHRRASAMSPEDRYEYLVDWVLPGVNHADLRLALDFTPTDPPLPVLQLDALDQQRLELAEQEGTFAVSVGGSLVSPALDLVDTARSLGKLDEIRRRVERAAADDPSQLRSRLAMLSIIDIARQDFASAGELLVALFAQVEAGEQTEFAERWPETLAVQAALAHTQTRGVGRDLAFHLFFNQAREGKPSGSEAWRRHVIAMAGLAQWFDRHEDESIARFHSAPPLKQWRGESDANCKSLGLGYPRAHWEVLDDGAVNLASHATDYLFFRSPLVGDYEVQAVLPAFGWRDTNIVTAGCWTGLIYTKDSYEFGDLSGTVSRVKFDPPVRDVGRTLHYRIVVRDGVQTTFVDGRVLHRQPLEPDHPPWTAVRGPRQLASAKQLRITGSPQIPEEVRLSAPSDLGAWSSYYDDPDLRNSGPRWQRVVADARQAEIVGTHRADLAGSFAENLLRYRRPMWEDGTIRYEFYYSPPHVHCHPAIGRLALMLGPDGVSEHWITDGPFDRTGIDPANESIVAANRRGPEKLPLLEDAWNRVALSLDGNTIVLQLNDREVYRRQLEPTNRRQFGLFHYADQSEARVRGVVWRGDWPRELPPLAEQELADDDVSFLDESLAALPAEFLHDFAGDGFPEDRFLIIHGAQPEHFDPQPDGLHARRPGVADSYRDATFAPRLRIEGDFDVTAGFDALDTRAATPGSAVLMLATRFEDEAAQSCIVQRRQLLSDIGFERQVYQSAHVQKEDGKVQRRYSPLIPLEATAGRLRLARRGEQVYFLIAEGDSPLFRLVRTERVGTHAVEAEGIRMVLQTHMAGSVSAIWKSIAVRAEKLTWTPTQDAETVARLDRERSALAAEFVHDFTSDVLSPKRFHHWAFAPDPSPQPTGQRVVGVAANDWRSAGAAPKLSVRGDFDISFDFDILRADLPRQGDSSYVYLQIEFPGDDSVQAGALAQVSDTGVRLANSQVRLPDGNRGHEYRSLRQQQADPIVRLRLARRADRLYWLYATERSGPDQLLTEFKVSAGPIASQNIRLMVHTGGEARITEALWKRLAVRAEELVFFD